MMIFRPEYPNTIIALLNIKVGRQGMKQRNATIVNIISSVVFVPNVLRMISFSAYGLIILSNESY